MKTRIKITIWLFIAFVALAILHNVMYAISGNEEAVFFIGALISAAGFIVALLNSIVMFFIEKTTKKTKTKTNWQESKLLALYAWGIGLMVLGLILNIFHIGQPNFNSFGSVGNWLLYVGLISLIVGIFKQMRKSKKVTDERMYFVAAKANRLTFLSVVLISFAVIVIDGIWTITIPYHLFMSYFILAIILIYAAIYKILLKYN